MPGSLWRGGRFLSIAGLVFACLPWSWVGNVTLGLLESSAEVAFVNSARMELD